MLREWKAKREAEFETATREELHRLDGLPARLPLLLVEAFRDATAELTVTVDRLEAAEALDEHIRSIQETAGVATTG